MFLKFSTVASIAILSQLVAGCSFVFNREKATPSRSIDATGHYVKANCAGGCSLAYSLNAQTAATGNGIAALFGKDAITRVDRDGGDADDNQFRANTLYYYHCADEKCEIAWEQIGNHLCGSFNGGDSFAKEHSCGVYTYRKGEPDVTNCYY